MNPLQKVGRASALAALTLTLAACGTLNGPRHAPDTDWRDDAIYFAMTDRFQNGNPANDNGPNRNAGDRADRTNPLAWHGGDFAGLKAKIEEGYFKRMGFTAIWISPVVLQVPAIETGSGPHRGRPFAGYHGYWAEDFFRVDPHFGTLEDYKDLVQTAHRHGLKIVQDIVVNHAGYGAKLVAEKPDWFRTGAQCGQDDVTQCLAGLPDFRQEVPEVTRYLNDFVRYWQRETGIDGLRIDTMKHVPDSYWRQFFAAGGAGDPRRLWSVGEVFDGNPARLAHFMNELGAPSVFDFALYFAIKDQLSSADGDLGRVADVFAQDGVYRDPTRLTTFVDNHDVRRFVSEVTERGGTAAQAAERLDLALSLIYTSRGTPSVYQGTEIAQPGLGDPYDHPAGQGNREDMNFAALAGSTLDERLGALAAARQRYPALTRGAQQELWRPGGGAPLLAYRRVLAGERPVVALLNNGDTPLDLATLPGGGLPLLGTFGAGALTEITGRSTNLRVEGGRLLGTLPPRTLLAVAGTPGSAGTVNPRLPEVSGVTARAGDGAAELRWSAPSDPAVTGYRVYARTGGGSERLLNFAPLSREQTSFLVRGLANDQQTTFRVVTVDAQGAESRGVTAPATPSASNTVRVTFTVDARSQGNGPVELRRFDTGRQVEYPMTQVSRGVWKTDIELPLFREVKFKFGNDHPRAKNSGYEGPDQPDRSYVVGTAGNTYSGTYDFITRPVPGATVEGRVTGAGQALEGALVEATSADPKVNYALTFPDGSYTLFVPAGAQTLKATAEGYAEATQQATAPATDVDFALARAGAAGPQVGKYRIDGNLSDWAAPKVSVQSPGEGVFGPDNNWLTLRADSDADFLYLAYTYRVSGNSAILYLDYREGGAAQADRFEAWRQAATFSGGMGGADAFVARYGSEGAQVRLVTSDTTTPEVAASGYTVATSGTLPAQTVELAIPWRSLGLSGPPAAGVNVVGGIFGGPGYGAGDLIPGPDSTPSGANTIGTEAEQRRATFTAPVTVR
ncbi:alpha-amylase [Deinococcus sp. RL]|uniref:alpha-amylase family glycosyl hydrolase n=1 Tax=Deinococcus sp. RL TaxID=1489678 RepID=UPI0004D8BAAB|nr:alpha-amylase family glycosyl hydrolase [Deinococcus sp. RL]KEF34368.1 alpha-amylase [Deinococcus sp. RL]